jgi:hypothetical protein
MNIRQPNTRKGNRVKRVKIDQDLLDALDGDAKHKELTINRLLRRQMLSSGNLKPELIPQETIDSIGAFFEKHGTLSDEFGSL